MGTRINTSSFYKPLYLKDLDCSELIKRKFIFLKTNKSIPNLLVSGPPGSGKSTASK
jgi:Mg-chelatase subunit ChlI